MEYLPGNRTPATGVSGPLPHEQQRHPLMESAALICGNKGMDQGDPSVF
ncbi:hypothetical protein C4K09_1728 [Pseudomonas chlororaphis subsp. aureofaciens]|nr:hypothetical protein C4K09_1728 [Pseudomonas chlororaphis subsp. aureofaciens]